MSENDEYSCQDFLDELGWPYLDHVDHALGGEGDVRWDFQNLEGEKCEEDIRYCLILSNPDASDKNVNDILSDIEILEPRVEQEENYVWIEGGFNTEDSEAYKRALEKARTELEDYQM